jgi:hypothetical protein
VKGVKIKRGWRLPGTLVEMCCGVCFIIVSQVPVQRELGRDDADYDGDAADAACTAVWGLVLLVKLRIRDRRRRTRQHLDRQLLGRQLGRSLGYGDTGLPCRQIVVHLSADLTKTLQKRSCGKRETCGDECVCYRGAPLVAPGERQRSSCLVHLWLVLRAAVVFEEQHMQASFTCWLAAASVWSSLLSDTCSSSLERSSSLEAEGSGTDIVCSCCGMVVSGWKVESGNGRLLPQ